MPICKKCHRFRKKSVLKRHEEYCRPSKDELKHFFASKTGTHSPTCDCAYCIKRRAKKQRKSEKGKK